MSCIFTLTDDLDAEFPAVAARRLGLDRVPLLCAREVPVPGSLPRVIRVLVHYYAAEDHVPSHVYLGEAAVAAARPRVGTIGARWRSSSRERIRRIPVYPLAAGYDLGADVAMLASNESCFGARCPRWSRPPSEALGGSQPLPRPVLRSAAPARCRTATASRAERIALGNGSCDILLAAGEALLEPGAELVYAWPAFSVYPHLAAASGARAIEVPLDADDRHDLDAMAAEITVATRLVLVCNPNNPTSTSLGLGRGRGVPRARPAPRVRDPRRGLLRVRARARRHVRLARPAAPLAEPRAAADVLQGLRPGRAARRLRRCAASEDFRAAVDQVRQPFYLNVAAQAAAVEALAPPGRGRAPRHPDGRRADRARPTALRELGLWVADSDANFIWIHLPDDAGRGRRRCGLARARRAGPRGRVARARRVAAGDGRDANGERAVPRRDRGVGLGV